jgi:transcriptional regulator with XRE-family HTH domain
MDQRLISYLRPLRRRWRITQAELAFLIGTKTHAAVSRMEALKAYPHLAQSIACSIVFDIPPPELFPEMKASLRLAGTVPASLRGAAAALHYVRERYEVGHYPMYEEDGYRLLLFSTERAVCAAAGLAIARRRGD